MTAPAPSPADTTSTIVRTVRCPQCGGESLYAPSNPHRPFCSERCRQIDPGVWASDGYRVPSASGPDAGHGDPTTGD